MWWVWVSDGVPSLINSMWFCQVEQFLGGLHVIEASNMSAQNVYHGAPLIQIPLGPSTGGWIVEVSFFQGLLILGVAYCYCQWCNVNCDLKLRHMEATRIRNSKMWPSAIFHAFQLCGQPNTCLSGCSGCPEALLGAWSTSHVLGNQCHWMCIFDDFFR